MNVETNNLVSIARVGENIKETVKKAIDLVGGMETVVNPGEEIYLKPNFVGPRDSSKGVTTNLEIIREVASEVRRCDAVPILIETPAIDFDKDRVYEFLGIYDFARENGIRIAETGSDLVKVPIHAGSVFKYLTIPRLLHKAKIINIPKLKTHVSTKMSCALKNLIGVLPDSEKRRVHIKGVHEAIADIYKVLKPILILVDAINCMEGEGPTYGDEIEVGLLVASKDSLAADKVCSQIIGLPWEDVKYIKLANEECEAQEIEIVGDCLADSQMPFKIPQKSALYHLTTRMLHVLDVGFSMVSSQHLNQFLFSTGYFGTNVRLIKEKCDGCGKCVEACPLQDILDIETHKVNYKKCIRCVECYFACNRNAIVVKGFSRPERL